MVNAVDDFDRFKWMLAGGMYVERRTGCRTPENDDPPSRCLADPLAEAALIALTGSRVLGAGVRKKHPQG